VKRSAMMIVLALVASLVPACEDAPTTPFIPEYVVQGYLIVGEPIGRITVARSQSVLDSFAQAKGAITDARVTITVDGRDLTLTYRPDTLLGEYYYADSSERVRPNTLYGMRVELPDGSVATASTLTPEQITWTRRPADTVVYPSDVQRTPFSDSLRISWTTVPRVSQYLLRLRTLDTLGYGQYLSPPTSDTNTRVEGRRFGRNLVRWSIAPASDMIAPFTVFRWHGLHEIEVFAPDENFLDWYRMTELQQRPQYDPILGNMSGALGSLTSASVVTDTVFVLKPRE
jgi:hypothetical protein